MSGRLDRYEDRQVMYISIMYRLAAIIMMLTLVGSQQIYPGYDIRDTTLGLLSIASMVSLIIYSQVNENPKIVRIAVIIESILLLVILFLTGGFHSPVIWLIATPAVFHLFYFESRVYMTLMITAFISVCFLGMYFLGIEMTMESIIYLPGVILSLAMLLVISLLASQYRKNKLAYEKMMASKKELERAKSTNKYLNEWLNNSYSLIENLLVSKDEKEGITKIFSYCALAIPAYGFYMEKNSDRKRYSSSAEIERILKRADANYEVVEYDVEGVVFLARFGLVYMGGTKPEDDTYRNRIDLILKITALFFERNELMAENEDLLIRSEQKRIAEEMHDGLNQDLHGTSFMLYDIIKNHRQYTQEEIIDKLSVTYDAIKNASQTLKQTIFQLNQTKQVYEWHEGVMAAAQRLQSQYGIFLSVEFDESTKDVAYLSPLLFDTFRRILKESVANAVEHGGAEKVTFTFVKDGNMFRLKVVDNGVGFIGNPVNAPGLGIKNMQKLVKTHGGNIQGYNHGATGAVLEMSFAYED